MQAQSSPPHDEAVAYYRLCDNAERVGVPTSLDDPSSPSTVAALRQAVEHKEAPQLVADDSVGDATRDGESS
jgi:dihydroorotase-like cyclic amidohydrolase